MTDDVRALLISALHEQDKSRPRSKQIMLGPSSLGSCKRQTVYRLMGTESVNPTSQISAIMGTAIHGAIESALRAKGYSTVEMTVAGIPNLIADAHIDFVKPVADDWVDIVDWKTTKKSNLRYFPYDSQRWQVQTYGFLAARSGLKVRNVEIVAIARDGIEKDIAVHSEPYNEAVAIEALTWLAERYEEARNGVLPEPEKYQSFCRLYCSFFSEEPGYCQGKSTRTTGVSSAE